MKREKHRLILTGADDAYAKRDAVTGPKPTGDSATAATTSVTPTVNSQGQFAEKPRTTQKIFAPRRPVSKLQYHRSNGSIQINYRLNLGKELSERLRHLAAAHDQPIDLVMKGLRNKAADRFKTLASGGKRPAAPDPASGGLSTRYAAVFTGDIAENLTQWFDPFDLGLAKDACKPILVRLFQDEARALCDTESAGVHDGL